MRWAALLVAGMDAPIFQFASPSAQDPVVTGIIGIVTPADTQRLRDMAAKEPARDMEAERRMTELASYIDRCWQAAKDAKTDIERRITECRMMVKRQYPTDVLTRIKEYGGSEAYIGTVSTKCMAAESWLSDILLPPDDKPWELQATPIPDLPEDAVQQIVQVVGARADMMSAMGQMMPPDEAFRIASELRDKQLSMAKDEANIRAHKMETVIEDELVDGNFGNALRDFIQHFVQTPAGILKSPVIRQKKLLKWEGATPRPEDSFVYECECVDPMDFYPAPRMRPDGINNGYIIERMMLTRKELVAFRGVPGVDSAAIDEILNECGEKGNRSMIATDSTRDAIAGRNWTLNTTPSDAEFEVLEFWGSVSGKMLIDWGLTEGITETEEYEVVARKSGNRVIHAMVNPDPMGRRPYHVASFRRDATSIWGEGLPEVMTDVQEINNSIIRHFQNNQAYAACAQVAVDASKLAPGQDFTKPAPNKVWIFDKLPDGQVPIHFFQAASNVEATIRAYTFFDRIADDISGIPKYTYGGDGEQGGAGSTMGGLSMLMGNASKRMRDVVTSIDLRIIKPVVEAYFLLNMLNHEDPSIKGDVQIVARGALSLMVKETVQQRRGQFLASTANPVDMQIMGVEGRARLLREVAKSLNMPDGSIVPDELELQRRLNEQKAMQMAQSAGQPPPVAAPQPGGNGAEPPQLPQGQTPTQGGMPA